MRELLVVAESRSRAFEFGKIYLVGAKHSGDKYLILTNKLETGMLRPLLYNIAIAPRRGLGGIWPNRSHRKPILS